MREVLRFTAGALRRRGRPLARLGAWSAAEALPVLLTGHATARAVDEGFLAGRPGVGLGWLGVLAVAIGVGAVATGRTYACLGVIVEPVRDDLARRVVAGALHQATAAGARPSDTAPVARLTHQVEIVRDTFAGLVMVVRGFLVTAGAALLGLVSLTPVVTGVVAVPLVAGLLLFVATLPTMADRQRAYVHADERLGAEVGAALAGHRDVTACGGQDVVAEQVGRQVARQAEAERGLARMAALRSLILAVGGWLPLAALLVAAPWLVRTGLSAGALLGALVYVATGLQPALHSLVQGVAGGGLRFAVTLDRILAATGAPPPAPTTGPSAAPARGATGPRAAGEGRVVPRPAAALPAARPSGANGPVPVPDAELRSVTVRYGPHARPVLDNLDLTLPPGEHLAVVGPSGVGKSTLAVVLAGLLPPRAGTVRLDGAPVDGLDPAALAARRVLIPQEAYVFTGTLWENLRYLNPDADEAAVAAAVAALGVEPLVNRVGGLAAPVDPGALSAGERQLVAAARAYLSPAPLAILDEATCHLDPAAEARVEAAFAARPGTLVVVAHRISSALRARRVLILEDGRALLGRHDELLARSATYRALVGHWHGEPDLRAATPAGSRPAPVATDPGR
ncbi:ABC transporter ATP-binding protein [Micromonospora sp. HM5-17]|uniref:ATP-binding cassette domain-containing protein n=1 Tax=Micromonospora sp. HM5-17 TaxID=2487710 RepID=UPI000F460D4B|nr:ABC transporter ATP-binding protein [Micromonospora sp. HM5-17]ROT29768.1 ABC transporter ATP-binding protein [Micromonospora sp. HM5-17]